MPARSKKTGKIKPQPEDYARIEREHGPLPDNATDAQIAEHYRLAWAAALIRLYAPENAAKERKRPGGGHAR